MPNVWQSIEIILWICFIYISIYKSNLIYFLHFQALFFLPVILSGCELNSIKTFEALCSIFSFIGFVETVQWFCICGQKDWPCQSSLHENVWRMRFLTFCWNDSVWSWQQISPTSVRVKQILVQPVYTIHINACIPLDLVSDFFFKMVTIWFCLRW